VGERGLWVLVEAVRLCPLERLTGEPKSLVDVAAVERDVGEKREPVVAPGVLLGSAWVGEKAVEQRRRRPIVVGEEEDHSEEERRHDLADPLLVAVDRLGPPSLGECGVDVAAREVQHAG
jgi:hypothetical protein